MHKTIIPIPTMNMRVMKVSMIMMNVRVMKVEMIMNAIMEDSPRMYMITHLFIGEASR